ncbi:DUF2569 domain-containing protein [Cohnella sp. JJ-181]|uniref:DUF2569 domain-containing protein n=1 Tax=Cohnella rhizoplanae TaxID=2974897 RepID=UPI0022FF7683|nr:DUF2569 domain-containing protein [Cohnella sp. JJ-181]CAI6052054.1 hypothetical protein COHCIP112018_01516 [Cohnella sp. JJ-181]
MEPNLVETKNKKLHLEVSGLGGWLVLVQIGLIFTTINAILQLINTSIPSLSNETWTYLTSKQSLQYHPLWGVLLIFETIVNALFFILSIYVLIAFYQKKANVPKLMINYYIASFLLGLVDLALIYQIPLSRELDEGASFRATIRSFITCLIWIPYFLNSQRVKNTFLK